MHLSQIPASLLCARPLAEPWWVQSLAFKLLEQNFNKTCSFKCKPAFLDEEFNNWTVVLANRINLYKIVQEPKPVCLHYRSKVYERFISGCGCYRDWNTTFFTNGNVLTWLLYKIWKKSFSSWQNTLIIVYLMRFPLKNNNHQSLKCFILLWTEDRLVQDIHLH